MLNMILGTVCVSSLGIVRSGSAVEYAGDQNDSYSSLNLRGVPLITLLFVANGLGIFLSTRPKY